MKLKINSVVQVIPGYTFRTAIENNLNGKDFVLQAQDINPNKIITNATALKRAILPLEARPVYLQQNDIVMVTRGYGLGSFKATIYKSDIKNVIPASTMLIIRPDLSKILPEYLCYYLNTNIGQRQILENSTGSVVQAVSRVKFEQNVEVPCPQLEKQHKIVAAIQTIQEYSEALSKKSTILNNISQSIIMQMQ